MEDRNQPISGVPNPDVASGSPLDIRDRTLKPHAGLTDDRSPRAPNGGFTAESAQRNAFHHTVTPSVTEKGWSTGGMAIPAVIIVVAIAALAALAF